MGAGGREPMVRDEVQRRRLHRIERQAGMIVLTALKIAIVIAALTVAYYAGRVAYVFRKEYFARMIWGLAAAGIYWVFYYVRSLLGITLGLEHQIWVRVPLLFTLTFIACCAFTLLRRVRHGLK